MRKLLIAEDSGELTDALGELFRGTCQVRLCTDGDSARQLLSKFQPDVLVLDLMLPGYDGLSLLQWAGEQGLAPLVLATSWFCSDYVVQQAQNLGVRYLMRKPCSISAMAQQISALLVYEPFPEAVCREPDGGLRRLLTALGVPGKLRGGTYLRYAVPLYAADPLQSVTKVLYPQVAKRCGCEASHVERSIRSTIDAAWQHRDERIWRLYFPPDETGAIRRPTNSAFIARVAQCLENMGQEPEKNTENVQNSLLNRGNVREE